MANKGVQYVLYIVYYLFLQDQGCLCMEMCSSSALKSVDVLLCSDHSLARRMRGLGGLQYVEYDVSYLVLCSKVVSAQLRRS